MTDLPADSDLLHIAERLGGILHGQQMQLATAESCTGGWVAKTLTDVVGSSAWFERGFVTYTNQAKQDMLGVDGQLIAQHGAVSEATVRAMAEGALQHSPAQFSLAITGIAGPGGGTPVKPVGLVWFAWARRMDGKTGGENARDIQTDSENKIFKGEREAVRRQAVVYALNGMLDRITN